MSELRIPLGLRTLNPVEALSQPGELIVEIASRAFEVCLERGQFGKFGINCLRTTRPHDIRGAWGDGRPEMSNAAGGERSGECP